MQQKGGTAETQTTAVLERVQGQAGAWRREDLAHPQVTGEREVHAEKQSQDEWCRRGAAEMVSQNRLEPK